MHCKFRPFAVNVLYEYVELFSFRCKYFKMFNILTISEYIREDVVVVLFIVFSAIFNQMVLEVRVLFEQ